MRRRVWNSHKAFKEYLKIMDYFPIALKIKKKLVVVAGGGGVAQRKISKLLEAGAKVRVVSPTLTKKLQWLLKKKLIKWRPQKIKKSDIKQARLVIAATNDVSVNKKVSSWCKKSKIAINVVDKPVLSNFISPALLRAKKALIAVYTDGKDPILSRDLKNYIKERWNDFLSYRNKL